LRLVAAHGLLRDFSESPVTSVSLEAERTPLDQRSLGGYANCKPLPVRRQYKNDRTTRRSSF